MGLMGRDRVKEEGRKEERSWTKRKGRKGRDGEEKCR